MQTTEIVMKLNPQEYIRKLLLIGFSEKKISEKARVSQSTIHRIKVGGTPG
jgi:predicted transcriptional regulator